MNIKNKNVQEFRYIVSPYCVRFTDTVSTK